MSYRLSVDEREDDTGVRNLSARCTCGWRCFRRGVGLLAFLTLARAHTHRDAPAQTAAG